jgi:hypothetical protein
LRNARLEANIGEERASQNGNREKISRLERELNLNKKRYAEKTASANELENQIAALNNLLLEAQNEKRAATEQLQALMDQNENLKRELTLVRNIYFDQPLVESVRGSKDKLVVRAGRTKKLKATVVLPANLKDIAFKVYDPQGRDLSSSSEQGMVAVKVINNAMNVLSSSEKSSTQTFNQVEMVFLPRKKLSAGTYKIEVLSEGLSVGSMQVKLR